MELEEIVLREIIHTEKDEYPLISLICGIENKTKQMNKPNRTETDSDVENQVIVAKEVEVGSWKLSKRKYMCSPGILVPSWGQGEDGGRQVEQGRHLQRRPGRRNQRSRRTMKSISG